jgi:serine/threonine protein kinase
MTSDSDRTDSYRDKLVADRYRLQDQIGRGESASVFLASDLWRKGRVAVKLFNKISAVNRASSRLHQLEAEAMRRVNHPHIVRIFDCGKDHDLGHSFLVMEYVEGQTLDKVLPKVRSGRYQSRVKFVLSILDALEGALSHAHARGVVHRDLKPHNFIYTTNGCLKVTDFGVARVQGAREYTMANISLGTPVYMSPEQLSGSSVDARTDIYAIGVLIHNILSDTNMFPDCRDFCSLLTEKLNFSKLYLPRSSTRTVTAIGKAVAVQPEDRFDSIELFLSELRRALQRELRLGFGLVTVPSKMFK